MLHNTNTTCHKNNLRFHRLRLYINVVIWLYIYIINQQEFYKKKSIKLMNFTLVSINIWWNNIWYFCQILTYWGWVMHICVSKMIIGYINALLPDQHQAIIWTSAGILLTGPLGINLSEILIEIHLGFNELRESNPPTPKEASCWLPK